MRIKIRPILFVVSLVVNGIIIFLLVLASFSNTKNMTFFAPDDHITAAAFVSFPQAGYASFDFIEIGMKPLDTAFLQFSTFSVGKQGNLLLNTLYDPHIISVTQTGYGIEIHALSEGFTLMQTLTNVGIKDIALIRVSYE